VARLSDPAPAIARLAQDKSEAVRMIAARKTGDPALLLQLARSDASAWVSKEAAARITDLAVLEELALDSPHVEVRRSVVPRVTDPQALARVAKKERDHEVQSSINVRTQDRAVLADLAQRSQVITVGCSTAANAQDVATLRRLAAQAVSLNIRRVAQLRLLMEHPPVRQRTEGLQLTCMAGTVSQAYRDRRLLAPGAVSFTQQGESAELRLSRNGALVMQRSWRTSFPSELAAASALPLPVWLDISPLALAVLDQAALDPAELAALGGSDIGLDIRLAAIGRISDADALRRLAATETAPTVREAIQARLQFLAGH
jgi:hypothetical protein